jgi:hypothetical protein
MEDQKLTEWFPAETEPVRIGVYETQDRHGTWMNLFDGERWHWGHKFPEEAAMKNHPMPLAKLKGWRGLAEQPKGSAK